MERSGFVETLSFSNKSSHAVKKVQVLWRKKRGLPVLRLPMVVVM